MDILLIIQSISMELWMVASQYFHTFVNTAIYSATIFKILAGIATIYLLAALG